MLAEKGKNIEAVHHALTTYAYNVWALAQSGYTDEAKAAEDALINIVNIAYSCTFENLNKYYKNYPGIDWRERSYRTGLQITTTKSFEKIKKSIDAIIANKVETSSIIWFLIINPSEYKVRKDEYCGYSIKIITITDLIRQICILESALLLQVLSEIKSKLNAWLPPQFSGSYKEVSFHFPALAPREFITCHNFWCHLEDRAEVPSAVFSQLSRFTQEYCKLPPPAKTVIAKIIQHSELPSRSNKSIEIKLQNLYFHLSDKEQEEIIDLLEVVQSYGLGRIFEKNYVQVEGYDEPTFRADRYFELHWRVCEPDYDVFAALTMYYAKYSSRMELFNAFENSDFRAVL
jgi:hypothetical protein